MSATKEKKVKVKKQYDFIGQIIAFENSELLMDEVITLFIYLLNTGKIYSLQGHYQHTVSSFLRTGAIVETVNGYERGGQ